MKIFLPVLRYFSEKAKHSHKGQPSASASLSAHLCRRLQHIFDEDAVALRGVVNQDMGNGADEFAVLDDGTAGHADVKCGTKEFCVFLQFLCVFAGKRQVFTHLNQNP